MRRLLTLPGLLLAAATASAGPAPLQWTANFNPATGGEETVMSAVTTAAGETHVLYVISDRYLRIAKFDVAGASIGTVILENPGNELRWDLALAMDSSGNYVVGGRGHTSNDSDDIGAAKWSPTGSLLWASLNVTSGSDDSGFKGGMGLDAAGNVYVIGRSWSGGLDDTILVKFNSSGVFQWAATTDAVNTNYPTAFTVLPAGGATYVAWYQGLGLSRIRNVSAAGSQVFLTTSSSYEAIAWSGTSYVAALQVSGNQTRVDELSAGSGTFGGVSQSQSFGSGGMYPHTITVRPSGEVYVFGQFGLNNRAVPYISAFGPHQNAFPIRWSRSYDVGVDEGGGNSGGFVGTVDAGGTLYISNGSFPNSSGSTCSGGGDVVLRRVTPTTGVPLLRTVWDGPLNASAVSMAAATGGDVLLTTENPGRVVKYNSGGTLMWSRSFTSSTSFCVSSMDKVISDGTLAYVAIDARISATFCCLADEEDLVVAKYNLSTGADAGFWSWTAVGEVNMGPMKFDPAGNVLYIGYGDGTGGGGKIAAVAAFNKITGVCAWSRTLAETVIDSVTGLSVDAAGNIYASFPYMNGGEMVTRITKFASSGSEIWTRTVTTGSPLVLGLGSAAIPANAGIFLAGGEADNFPPSQTYFHGFIQRIDANGDLQWTRTADAGEQLVYFGVEVSASGTLMTAGFAGPAFEFGDGINAGGLGDIVVHAWDPNASGCAAPMWGGRYDSGYGDESPVGLVAGSMTVATSTSNGPIIVKFGDGSSDTPVLDTRIVVSPSPAEFHPTPAIVTITVTTTNTGGRDALFVAPALLVTSTAYLSVLTGPSPSAPVALQGGASQTWTWTATVVGAGTQMFSVTVSGLDSCGGATITAVKGAPLTTGYRADMVGDMWQNGYIFGIGDLLEVTLTVTNNGIATALVNSVSVTLYQDGGTIFTPSGQYVQGTGPLAAGASGVMHWTLTATNPGSVFLGQRAGWVDALFGFGMPGNVGGDSVTVYDQARLNAALAAPATVSVGQVFTVRLTVTNVGAYTAAGVVPALDVNIGAGLLTAKGAASPAGPVSLVAPGFTTFVWTFTATGAGPIAFTATALGTDTSPLGYVARGSASTSGLVQTPAALSFSVVLSSTYIRDGDVISLLHTVTNTGQADVAFVWPGGWHAPDENGDVVAMPQPTPPLALPGGGTTSFVMSFRFARPNPLSATIWLTGTITGIETNTGILRFARVTTTVYIRAAAAFDAAVVVAPADVAGGQVATVTMTVTNTGSGVAFNVTPVLLRSSTVFADLTSGPTPASAPVLTIGASQVFTWELTGRSFGTVLLSVTVAGSQSDSAPIFLSRTSTLNVTSSLNSSLTASTAEIREGDSFTLSLSVKNGGGDPILSVSPLLLPVNAALVEVTAGPTPVSDPVMLSNETSVFAWTVRAKRAGTATFTATATGINSSTSLPDSTKAVAIVTIKPLVTIPDFDTDAIVFPNPVTGDAMQVAVKLDAGITEITMEVYNTGFQRVYHGEWTGLTGSATLLDVKGMADWAPGAYFIKMTGFGSGTKIYPTVRMRIKRTGTTTP